MDIRTQILDALDDYASHEFSERQHGTFYYNDSKVIGYGLVNDGGGEVTVFSFLSSIDAEAFFNMMVDNGCSVAILNDAQIICMEDYNGAFGYVDTNQIVYGTYAYGMM